MSRYPNDLQGFARLVQAQFARSRNGRMGARPPKGASMGIGGLVLLGGGLMLVNSSLFNVDGGHRAVLYSRLTGVKQNVLNEGTHFAIPWFQTPILYDVRSKPRNIASLTGTNDLQMVNITCRVLSRPDVKHLTTLHRTLGPEYDERVLPSIVNEVLKGVVAQFNASQLITQRDVVSRLIRDNLMRRASKFHILLDDVSITHMSFSPEFTRAVEAKQIAEQDAQRASIVVDKAKQEKVATIVRAQGEARSAELIGEAIKKSRDYVELKRLQTAAEISQILANSPNRVILDNEALLLNTITDSRVKK
ncbi:HBL265Wp [Eremothecium sinecaudum]|uniref:Prohibitin n=1 Tax=Eremothecium sinecaudum TaxID=45286 RepID=A0A109UWV8_9SACH|nr:HBL265Wp [Eremothecium sinecaudum]AMD18637.1 HBL265Wp [Eremothecium sinecaudum]